MKPKLTFKAYLYIAILITGFLVRDAVASPIYSGMQLLKTCTSFEKGKNDLNWHNIDECLGFIEGTVSTLDAQIFREEIHQLGRIPLEPRKLCVPKNITTDRLMGQVIEALEAEYKKDGDLALRFGAGRNLVRLLLKTFPCKNNK